MNLIYAVIAYIFILVSLAIGVAWGVVLGFQTVLKITFKIKESEIDENN